MSGSRLPSSVSFARHLRERIYRWWWLKALGTTVVMSGFFLLYFELLNRPRFPLRTMPLVFADHWIPFLSWAIFPYFSLWIYVSLAPALLWCFSELWRYLVAALALSAAGFAVFYWFPTQVPSSEIDWAQYPMIRFLKEADHGGNAFPSLHVAFAVFSAFVIQDVWVAIGAPRWARVGNVGWALAIVLSTMATRQHVFLDVVGGSLIGALAGLFLTGSLRRVRNADTATRGE